MDVQPLEAYELTIMFFQPGGTVPLFTRVWCKTAKVADDWKKGILTQVRTDGFRIASVQVERKLRPYYVRV